MKHYLFLFLLCSVLSGQCSLAQDTFSKDTLLIKSLFKEGNRFIDGPSDSLLHYYNKALRIVQNKFAEHSRGEYPLTEDQFNAMKLLEMRATIELGIEHFFQSDYPRALEYYFQALTIAEKHADAEDISECYSEIGIVYKNQGKYDLALEYYQQALELAEQTTNDSWIASCNTNIGNVYKEKGYFIIALDYYLKALETFEQLGHTRRISACYENIGEVYYHQKDLEKALFYFNKALDLARESDYRSRMSTCFMNIGKTHIELGNTDFARTSFEKALEILDEQGYTHELDDCYKGIARTYFMEDNLGSAMEYYLMALDISQQENDKASIAETMESLGKIFLQTGDIGRAIEYFTRSLEMAREIGSLQIEMQSYFGLANAHDRTGNHQTSLAFFRIYDQVKDSLFSVEKYKAITEMAVKYDSEKKEQELALLTEKHQVEVLKVGRRNRLIIGIVILAFLSMMIGYLLFRQKELKARQQSTDLEQKFLRAQMNPHFIFNSLIAIQSYIYKKDPMVAGDYLAKFAELVRMILENSRVEFIALEKEIKTMDYYLELQSLRFENVFDYHVDINDDIDVESIQVPPMFAQPFIENAIEHGLRHLKEKGLLTIKYTIEDKQLVCSIEDNGIGREKAKEVEKEKRHRSLATSITRERLLVLSKKYKQRFSLDLEDLKDEQNLSAGTKVILRIPYIS